MPKKVANVRCYDAVINPYLYSGDLPLFKFSLSSFFLFATILQEAKAYYSLKKRQGNNVDTVDRCYRTRSRCVQK